MLVLRIVAPPAKVLEAFRLITPLPVFSKIRPLGPLITPFSATVPLLELVMFSATPLGLLLVMFALMVTPPELWLPKSSLVPAAILMVMGALADTAPPAKKIPNGLVLELEKIRLAPGSATIPTAVAVELP